MASDEEDSLEHFLNKATEPSRPEQDMNAVMSFCDRVNNELEGPQVALRLLAHKMQSPQEREAMNALVVLEQCVQNCGGRFHQEIGKFRFLNEMIKVVSPKYLGAYSSEKVKARCIEMLFAWSTGLPHEPKIKEAYSMLKKQNIVKEDPILPNMQQFEVPPPRTDTIFEDEDKSKQLARLLKSKNPEDLQAANRLIKNMVKQDIEKTEKKSKRMQELETVNNNIKLLSEMLNHYSSGSSDSDKEILKELYDSLEKKRPTLFRLASDTDEKENDAMMEILKTNDAVVKIMSQYQSVVEGKSAENGLLLDTQTQSDNAQSGAARSNMDELGDIFGGASASSQSGNILDLVPPAPSQLSQAGLASLFASAGAPPVYSATPTSSLATPTSVHTAPPSSRSSAAADDISILDTSLGASATGVGTASSGSNLSDLTGVFASAQPSSTANVLPGGLPQPLSAQQQTPSNATQDTTSTAAAQPKRKGGFSDLEDLSVGLMKQTLGDNVGGKPFVPSSTPAPKLSLNQMQNASNASQQKLTQPATPLVPGGSPAPLIGDMGGGESPSLTSQEVQPLTNVSVKLESIQPGAMPSLTAYDKNDLKIVIHFGKDRPRPDVQVMVVSVMSTKPAPVKHFQFQAAVPKVMKVKLQPASATDLPAHNPILPSAAITQVMLVANPQNEKIRIKFKVTYMVNDVTQSDIGDVEIPQASLL